MEQEIKAIITEAIFRRHNEFRVEHYHDVKCPWDKLSNTVKKEIIAQTDAIYSALENYL